MVGMGGELRFDKARSISLDFDGVLSTLILGRPWVKARAHKHTVPFISALTRSVEMFLGVLTQGLRTPFPHAEDVLRELRASEKTLSVLTSRTGAGVAEARRWLDRFGWRGYFDQLFFNVEGDDADAFKARVLRATPIDVHIDDDPETLGFLAGEFPERLFVHMNCYNRRSLAAPNIAVVHSWRELPALFFPERRGAADVQKE